MHFFKETFLPKIAPLLSLSLVTFFVSAPFIASAQTAGDVASDILSITDPVSWFAAIGVILLSLTGVILALSGSLLNYAVAELVITMGEKINSISTIQSTWVVLRDFANVFFVFVLLFIGIATILNVSKYGYKSLARNLIIAAILVNFSLFFAQIIIDTSNLLAKEVFGLINIESTTDPRAEEFVNDGISGAFMYQLDLVSLYETSSSSALPSGGEISNEKIILITLFGSIFFVIVSFIFLAAAFLLITRFVYLLMLMILSPIVFAAWVLPETKKYWTKWWSKLLQQSFFAPAYFFLVYISLKVMEGFKVGGVTAGVDSGTFAQAIAGDGVGGGEIILNFFIVAAFMVMSIVLAQMFGAYGASGTIKLGKSLRNRAIGATTRGVGGVVFGTSGAIGRAGAGLWSNRVLSNEKTQRRASQKGFGGFVARRKLNLASAASTASFDARNTGLIKSAQKAAGFGVDLGKAQKGGYAQVIKDQAKRREEMGKKISEANATEEETKEIENIRAAMTEAENRILKAKENDDGTTRTTLIIEEAKADLKQNAAKLKSAEAVPKTRANVRKQEYANNLATSGGLRGFFVGAGDRAGAAKIRKEKSTSEKILAAMKDDESFKKEITPQSTDGES